MTAELNIRPIRGRDRDRWQVLWRDYLAFYGTDVGAAIHETSAARALYDTIALPSDFMIYRRKLD